jgi:hypothetical protein
MSLIWRLLIAAILAYVVIGLVYSTWWTAYLELGQLGRADRADIPPPWSSPMAFLAWFVLPAALWPWNVVGFHRVPEILVATVYLATVGLFYLAAGQRSAPRHLKSTYPDHH